MASVSGMRFLTLGGAVFLSTLGVMALSLNAVWAADHPTSLLQLAYAFWSNHSPVLVKTGQFFPGTVDDFQYPQNSGTYYSALAPGASFLSLPFTGLGFVLDGGFSLFGNAMLLSELFVSFCNAVAAYFMFKLASMYFTRRTSAFLAFAYAFSTITWAFATYFFESDVSAMLDLVAVFLAVRMARRGSLSLREAVACGAALGAGFTVDYINFVFVPVISVFLLYSFRGRMAGLVKGLAALLATSSAGAVLLGLYDLAAFGNPLVTSEQVYDHTTSVFQSFSYPLLAGLYLDLFSPLRGVFLYCPVLVVGVVGCYYFWQHQDTRGECVFLVACFLAILIPYSMWYNAEGGEGFGPRFLIPAIPFLLLPAGFALEARGPATRAEAYLLYAVGVFLNGVSGLTTAIPQVGPIDQYPFLTHTLPLFLKGGGDTWWWKSVGSFWWVPSVLILGAALALPLVVHASQDDT
jgi:hypothetical protein